MSKRFLIFAKFLLILAICACEAQPTSITLPQEEKISVNTNSQPSLYTVIGVGDMMLGTNYPSKNYLPPNGGTELLSDVTHILQDADVTFGNLEGTILDSGGTVKRCQNPNLCYAFPVSYTHLTLPTIYSV